jgi:hypothetical protein
MRTMPLDQPGRIVLALGSIAFKGNQIGADVLAVPIDQIAG